MIRFQFDGEPIEVETVQDVVGLLREHTRIAVPYTIHVLDDQDGHIVIISEQGGTDEDSVSDVVTLQWYDDKDKLIGPPIPLHAGKEAQ